MVDQSEWPHSLEDYAQRLGPWFARHAADLGAADAVVRRVTRMSDGHSSVTLGVELGLGVGGTSDGVALVLRTNPSGPGLLDEYDLEKQFEMMRALDDSDVPVPTMLWFEEDPAVIGRPFFVMERVDAEIIEYAVPEWLRAAPRRRAARCASSSSTPSPPFTPSHRLRTGSPSSDHRGRTSWPESSTGGPEWPRRRCRCRRHRSISSSAGSATTSRRGASVSASSTVT